MWRPSFVAHPARVARESIKSALTQIYGKRLLQRVLQHPPPEHVGIILDGNRRHGRDVRLDDPKYIYALGAEKLDDVLTWCAELSIPAVTLWVLSTENLNRRSR